jgi:hypothetical protein
MNFTDSFIAENKTTTQETHEPTEKDPLLLDSQDVS